MTDRRQLKVLGPTGLVDAVVVIATEPPWSLTVELGDGTSAEATAQDLFGALERVRKQLEAARMLLCCKGARADVFPSGMARQSWGGRRAYQLQEGRKPSRQDLVDIFDPADCEDVVTVRRQYQSVERLRER
jgi:hypothetical protein